MWALLLALPVQRRAFLFGPEFMAWHLKANKWIIGPVLFRVLKDSDNSGLRAADASGGIGRMAADARGRPFGRRAPARSSA